VKKHISVFYLMARNTFFKFLLLLLVMAAVEGVLLWNQLKVTQDYESLMWQLNKSNIVWVFTAATALTAVLLSRTGCEYGSRTGYTIRRLAVSEKTVFFWQSVYNTLVMVILWAVQLGIVFLFCNLHLRWANPANVSNQTVFLAFWQVDFLHTLMPLQDTLRTLAVALFIPAFGFSTASFSYLQRRGKFAGWVPVVVMFGALLYQIDLDNVGYDMMFAFIFLLALTTTVYMVLKKEEWFDED